MKKNCLIICRFVIPFCYLCIVRLFGRQSHNEMKYFLGSHFNYYLFYNLSFYPSYSPLIFKIQSKRHRKDINFQWLFLVFLCSWVVFLGFWAQKRKNIRKSHRKLMSFQIEFLRQGCYYSYFFSPTTFPVKFLSVLWTL